MSTWFSIPMEIMAKDSSCGGVILAARTMIVAMACALSFTPILAREPMSDV